LLGEAWGGCSSRIRRWRAIRAVGRRWGVVLLILRIGRRAGLQYLSGTVLATQNVKTHKAVRSRCVTCWGAGLWCASATAATLTLLDS
jgi:hypothetical protein